MCLKVMILWQKCEKWHFCDENVRTIFELKVRNINARILFFSHFRHKIITMLLICFITYSSQNYHSCFLSPFHHKFVTFWSICYLHILISACIIFHSGKTPRKELATAWFCDAYVETQIVMILWSICECNIDIKKLKFCDENVIMS